MIPPHSADHQPGIVIENLGEILFVKRAVVLDVDVSPMKQLIDTVTALSLKIQELPNKFRFLRSDGFPLIAAFRDVTRMMTNHHQGRRNKRALAPAVGSVFSALFGTATQESVDSYAGELAKLTTWAKQKENVMHHIASSINANTQLIGRMEKSVSDIVGHINEELTETEKEIKVQRSFLILSNLLTIFIHRLEVLENAIALVDSGVVSSTLLSPLDLNKIVFQVKADKGWTPFFVRDKIDLYYNLLTPVRLGGRIFITIPFSPDEKYFEFHLTPFPSIEQDKIFQLNIPEQYVAISSELTKVILLNPRAVKAHCITKPQIMLCPSDRFPIVNFEHETCIKSILRSETVDKCPVKIVTPTLPLITVTHQFIFLFTPQKEELVIRCPNSTEIVKNMGPIKVKNSCSIESPSINFNPGHELDLSLRQSAELPNINQMNFTFSQQNILQWLHVSTPEPLNIPDDDILDEIPHQHLTIANTSLILLLPGIMLIATLAYLVLARKKVMHVLTTLQAVRTPNRD